MKHHIYAKEKYGSAVPRTLQFVSPIPKAIWRPNCPAFNEYCDLDGWVQVTLLNKLGNAIGTMSMETPELIDELTKVIAMLKEVAGND